MKSTIGKATYKHRGEKINLILGRNKHGVLKFKVKTNSPKNMSKTLRMKSRIYKENPENIKKHMKEKVNKLEEKLGGEKDIEEAAAEAFKEILEEKNADTGWRGRF